MIDLHSHILPGLDDGPSNSDFSVAMARSAVEDGTQMIVATPHIRGDYAVDIDEIAGRVEELNRRLAEEQLPLIVLTGGEIGWAHVSKLDDRELEKLRLGTGRYLLIESPYNSQPADLERVLDEVSERGFNAILAHPERCPLLQRDPERLAALVERGTLCSVTAGSLTGRFGERSRRFALDMFARGLVHDVASDAHDHLHRPPKLASAFANADKDLPGIERHGAWFTVTAPVAILAGRPLPPAPKVETRTPSLLRRLFPR
jgi:protein-tyrosine phosphatase